MTRLIAILVLLGSALGCERGFVDSRREFGPAVPEDASAYPVEIHSPTTLGVADTTLVDPQGRTIGVACKTCHGPTPDMSWAAEPDRPEVFHEAVDVRHGTLSCNACHDSEDRTKLHLADGAPLEVKDAMTLCAQCHGVQFRDYTRGSHGGMNGYWDLDRGPRDRNHCVDCHAPHAPAYGQVLPVHHPRDRYLDLSSDAQHPPKEAH